MDDGIAHQTLWSEMHSSIHRHSSPAKYDNAFAGALERSF